MESPSRVRFKPLGESALTFEAGTRAPSVALRLRGQAPHWLTEAVPSFGQVMVAFDPLTVAWDEVAEFCRRSMSLPDPDSVEPRLHRVPVCYELGEDLADVCGRLQINREEFVKVHSHAEYECHAIGFCPGFPYLGWLDDRIAGLPRKSTPRLEVPVGSVAVTKNLTGVYTALRPGGWWLVGRTPLRLCVPENDHFPIAVGDRVVFEPVTLKQFEAREGEAL